MSSSALRFPSSIDLSSFRRALWAAGITHLYQSDDSTQVIILTDPRRYPQAIGLWGRIQGNEPIPSEPSLSAKRNRWNELIGYLGQSPVCACLLGLCIVVFLWLQIAPQMALQWLSITPEQNASMVSTLVSFQWWRFFTPALMHFGIMHITFDLLWVWYLGRVIEARVGHQKFILLVLLSAGISNLLQLLISGPMFGGMSGVVYAFFGYCWLSNHLNKSPLYPVSNMLMGIMMIWLVIGMTPLFSLTAQIQMANSAHLGGLIIGLLSALVARWYTQNQHQH